MKILLVEDDVLVGAALEKVLATHHYIVDRANDGQTGLELFRTVEYDLILLDVQIPRLDGLSLCRELRSQGYRKPILLLTANDTDAAVVAGFDAGADDYIGKPCAPEVLLARMRTLLRRSGAIANHLKNTNLLTWGKLELDLEARRVAYDKQEIILTATEYNLLELFLRNPDRIFSRSAILDQLWGFDNAPTDRAIVTHVKDIRKKLKAGGLTEDILETIYGMGYRLKPAPVQLKTDLKTQLETESSNAESVSVPSSKKSAIDQVLQRFRGIFDAQVAVLTQASAALAAGDWTVEWHQSAKYEAHKLAGSLASFGYPNGSKLARSIEHWLKDSEGDGSSEQFKALSIAPTERTHFSELVAALQEELTKAPIDSTAAINSTAPTNAAIALETEGTPAIAKTYSHRVLVIDDDAALTRRLKAEADAWGFRMKIAPHPAAARSRLALSLPDVVLLDLSFPAAEDAGFTLLQEINQRSPTLPVIVFTGRDSLSDRLTVSRLGARQFLPKPATTEQIFQAIARVLPTPLIAAATVLIVDDDLRMLELLSSLLQPWGLEVATLSEPQHFWKVLVATSPHVVLLDLEMPQINGLELCQVVRQDSQWGNVPILVVTAHTDANSLQQAFAAGADDFITKPILGPELVTRVLSRIERHRLHPTLGGGRDVANHPLLNQPGNLV